MERTRATQHCNDIPLIAGVAWSFQRTTGIDFEELFGEAAIAYSEARLKHDGKRAKLSTFATTAMRNHLCLYIAIRKRQPVQTTLSGEDWDGIENVLTDPCCSVTDRLEFFESLLEGCNGQAADVKTICDTVFSNPQGYVRAGRYARRALEKTLESMGWEKGRIDTAFSAVKVALQN